jgi:Putative endonuclease segE, GIY-YIG domain
MWFYQEKVFTEDDVEDGVVGFVYLITNLETGKKYVGQKKFQKSRRVVSKTKRARRVYKSSDWATYYGSSVDLQEDVRLLGPDKFHREIIHLCRSKGLMNYLELKEQVVRDVLLKPDEYYNSFVGTKIHRRHILKA